MPDFGKIVRKAVEAAEGIKAYHGSPYKFDKFDLSKIGTGEGAQAYGHGLYFAENPAVAAEYQKRLSPARGVLPERFVKMSPDERGAIMAHAFTDADPLTVARRAQYRSMPLRQETPETLAGLVEQIRDAARGKMYEVNIRAHPWTLLDLDKRVAQQPPMLLERLDTAANKLPPRSDI